MGVENKWTLCEVIDAQTEEQQAMDDRARQLIDAAAAAGEIERDGFAETRDRLIEKHCGPGMSVAAMTLAAAAWQDGRLEYPVM